ncbi:MAG: hypothetical protein H6708_20680 [Kofleriaceae bacterium]|nr:hypothetical protein [Kofleriaceae bacterium]
MGAAGADRGALDCRVAALEARPGFAAVEPAWRDFIACYPALFDTDLADDSTILGAARLVYHHIGGEPLGTVCDHIYEDVQHELRRLETGT